MICHRDTPAQKVEGFSVELERQGDGQLWLRYHVDCPVDALELGAPAAAERTDELWRTTCFELFARKDGDAAYAEYNFAPSSQWAAYGFSGYRKGMRDLPLPTAPETGNDASESHFALEATVPLPPELQGEALRLAITAVIEEEDGTKSYWALRHPPGPPDFHHRDCFALKLAPPERA